MSDSQPVSGTCPVRVVNIYATPWTFNGRLTADEGTPDNLGELEEHYELYKGQLPRLLPPRVRCGKIFDRHVSFPGSIGVKIRDAIAQLYVLPSKQIVLAVSMCIVDASLDSEEHAQRVAKLLEECISGRFKIGNVAVEGALNDEFSKGVKSDTFRRDGIGDPLLPERHQLVFVPRSFQAPRREVVDEILYRDSLPFRPEFVFHRLPKQLNIPVESESGGDRLQKQLSALYSTTGQRVLGVVTPHVSLLYGHREYVENSIVLSTVHAVGTAARFRYIWRTAYEQVLEFREKKQRTEAGLQTRNDLEILADNLGNLEFELTFSVEFPLLRIATFQTELYEAMDLVEQSKALSQMFTQLGGSLRSEITAIEVRENRRTNRRRGWNSFAFGLLSFFAVPVGLFMAFLGINASDINMDKSMWSQFYAKAHLVAICFAFVAAAIILFPYLQEIALDRKDRRALWTGIGVTGFGGAVLYWMLNQYSYDTDFWRVADYFFIASGVFLLFTGLALIIMWIVRFLHLLVERRQDRKNRVALGVAEA